MILEEAGCRKRVRAQEYNINRKIIDDLIWPLGKLGKNFFSQKIY